MVSLRDRYDDLKAEWMTLQQTNIEYKRALQQKMKEFFQIQRELDQSRLRHEHSLREMHADKEDSIHLLANLQVERDMLKEHICKLEGTLSLNERDLKTTVD